MRSFDMPAEAQVTEMSFPTRVVFGVGALARLPKELTRLRMRRVLVVTDPGVTRAGLASRICELLARAGVSVELWEGASPHEKELAAGAQRYRAGGFDGLLALGGGTVIDAAKLVAVLAVHPGPLSRLAGDGEAQLSGLPAVVAVPTIAGAGAEASRFSIVSLQGGRRVVLTSPALLPPLALCDPELTFGVPPDQTASAGMEAFAHCVEGYLATGFHPLADAMAIDGVARVTRSLPAAVQQPDDVPARSDLMAAALEGAMAWEKGSGVCRALAHGLSAICQVPHALATAVVLPAVLEFNRASTTARLARVAVAMGDNSISREEVLAGNAIHRVRKLIAGLKLPSRLGELGVKEKDLEPVATAAFEDASHQANPRRCSPEALLAIARDVF